MKNLLRYAAVMALVGLAGTTMAQEKEGRQGRPKGERRWKDDNSTATLTTDIPKYPNLEALMKDAGRTFKRTGDKDAAIGAKANARLVAIFEKVGTAPYTVTDPPGFGAKSEEMRTAAKALGEALKKGDKKEIFAARQAVGKSCQACHDVFKKEDEDEKGERGGGRRGDD